MSESRSFLQDVGGKDRDRAASERREREERCGPCPLCCIIQNHESCQAAHIGLECSSS